MCSSSSSRALARGTGRTSALRWAFYRLYVFFFVVIVIAFFWIFITLIGTGHVPRRNRVRARPRANDHQLRQGMLLSSVAALLVLCLVTSSLTSVCTFSCSFNSVPAEPVAGHRGGAAHSGTARRAEAEDEPLWTVTQRPRTRQEAKFRAHQYSVR